MKPSWRSGFRPFGLSWRVFLPREGTPRQPRRVGDSDGRTPLQQVAAASVYTVQNAHAPKPGEPQLDPKTSAHSVADRAPIGELPLRDLDAGVERASPRLAESIAAQ